MQKKTFCAVLFAASVFYVLTVWQACADIDPTTAKKLLIADLAAQDYFGISVSLSADGRTALIGAFFDNKKGGAYIFTHSENRWTRQAKLTANDGEDYDMFGCAVSLSADGSTALIGASGDDDKGSSSGAAYIFTGSSSNWTQQAKLIAVDGADSDSFGSSVSLAANGGTALVGANGKDSWKGAAYIFTGAGRNWTQQVKLIANDNAVNDSFGSSVSLSANGGTALVGASGKESYMGAAYIFAGSSNAWTQQAKLIANDSAVNDSFGSSVSLSANGGTALIGAFGKESYTGAAYIFTGFGNAWTQQAKLTANDSAAHDGFGEVSLSAEGGTALIGAHGKGGAYIFTGSGSTWIQTTQLTASNSAAGYCSVALSPDGGTALIGVPYDTVHSAAYAFTSTVTSNNTSHAMPWLPLLLRQ